jgi:hypothetical protein
MTVAGRVDAVAQSEAGTARWWQLVIGIVCMAMIANLQYGWTLFVPPIDDKYHWGPPSSCCSKPGSCHSKAISSTNMGRG